MRLVVVLALALIAVSVALAEDAPSEAGQQLLHRLTAGVPAEELAPNGPETVAQASRAAGLLAHGTGDLAACASACGEAAPALELLCSAAVLPTAARSGATCYARALEVVARCEARCAGG